MLLLNIICLPFQVICNLTILQSLTGLRNMDLRGSENLKEIPDLSLATNLKKLDVSNCTSLVELSSTIQNLNQLEELQMERCENLENLPIGINLESLYCLNLNGCSKLRSFPDISTTISELYLSETAIEEFPTELHLENLYYLGLYDMKSEKLWKRVQVCSYSNVFSNLFLNSRIIRS